MNQFETKKQVVVKLGAKRGDVIATAKGGAALVEALALRLRLWSDVVTHVPKRRDETQGFTVVAWLTALVHGLLAGGRGFSATEPMRGDESLLAILGLKKAPSAETVEEVTKFLAASEGHEGLSKVVENQCVRLIEREKRGDLFVEGFVPVWGDGTLLETEGKTKDALVYINKSWGQMASGIFIGPYLATSDFSRPTEEGRSEGELVVTRRLLPRAVAVLLRCGLANDALFLMDSLYGENGTLGQLECIDGARYIVGANGLVRTAAVLAEQPKGQWRDTTASTLRRGWESSAVCIASIQCEGWEKKRTLVGRRWRESDEVIDNYSGIITNLSPEDPRVLALMKKWQCSFGEVAWRLYDKKQGMENQWKDLLGGMGLHTMPCGKAAVNAVFLQAAAIALNLKTGCVRLCLSAAGMMLWRFRRDVVDLAATVSRHARRVFVTLLDGRERLCREVDVGFARVASL